MLGVTETKLEWLMESGTLEPPKLSTSSGLPSMIQPGQSFTLEHKIRNSGQKIAKNLETYFVSAGPFVVPRRYRSRYRRTYLNPNEEWVVMFQIKVKQTIPGRYPLMVTTMAQNAGRKDSYYEINIST